MSVEAVKWAMDDAPMLRTATGKPDSTSRHVLQAMAEHADAKGRNCHPSVTRLQYRTGYDRRTVQRVLRRLEDAKLIVLDGMMQERNRYRLSMHLVRDQSDWADLERDERDSREAAAERKRKSRARRVTPSDDVTVTHFNDVTDPDVTHSASGRHALQVRDVTHFKSGRHALSAAVTTNQPPLEPSATIDGWGGSSANPPHGLAQNAPIDDDGFALNDAMRRWAVAHFPAIDVDHETEQFISHFRAEGTRRRSWPDEWQKWIRRSAKWASERPAAAGGSRPPRDRHEAAQRATDAMFDRAMTRARARMQQENP